LRVYQDNRVVITGDEDIGCRSWGRRRRDVRRQKTLGGGCCHVEFADRADGQPSGPVPLKHAVS